jgi:paraquat-inducible protein A
MDPNRALHELRACHCCGLAQWVGAVQPGERIVCARCRTPFRDAAGGRRRNAWAAAAALSALFVYPLGILLPVLEIERFGHARASSIWHGALALLAEGAWAVGLAVFLCSVVLPLIKLAGLLLITTVPRRLGTEHLRAKLWKTIEWVGRWGMLDVLLVALLVATLKLGDLVEVHPGPGLYAFTAMVILSLASSAAFDPHALWDPLPKASLPKNSAASPSRAGLTAEPPTR